MNSTPFPGFTAERSLHKTRAHHRMNAGNLVRAEGNIIPQRRIVATAPSGGQLAGICAEIGDIVNDFVQQSMDPQLSAAEQKEALAVAREMHNRSKGHCSFSVA